MIIDCPLKCIDPVAWEALETADWAADGKWPNAGGWLDETASVLAAVRMVRNEEAYWKSRTEKR